MTPDVQVPGNDAPIRRGFLRYALMFLTVSLPFVVYYTATGKALAFIDIGIDTFSYFYPIQVIQAEQLRQYGELTWSFRQGLGGYIGAAVLPTHLALAWLPDAWQLAARMPLYMLKLFLAGAFFFAYLRRLRVDPTLASIGALAYAFGNYAVINEQWDALVILQFSAYLYFLESYFRTSRGWFAVAAGLVVCAGGPFEPYVFALLTLVYLPARMLLLDTRDDARPLLPTLLAFAVLGALGAMLMAVVQVPNILFLLDSPRVSGDHAKFSTLAEKLLSLNSARTIGAEFAGLFGKDLLGTANAYRGYQNWFEGPGFYVGMLMLVCAPQLLSPSATRRERWGLVAGVVLLAAYLVWPAVRHAVYGFGHTGFRISTLWVSAGIVLAGVAGLRRACLSGVWRPGVAIAAAAIGCALAGAVWLSPGPIAKGYLCLVLAFAGMYLGLLWIQAGKRPGPALATVLCVMVAAELLLAAAPAFVDRRTVDTDGVAANGRRYDDGTAEAVALARAHGGEDEFYRIEKTFNSVFLNDALVQGYHGTKSYFFHGKSITRFVDSLRLPRRHPRANYISTMTSRPAILDLLGVRYILSRDMKPAKDKANRLVGSAGDIHVFLNGNARGVAHLYRNVVGESVLADVRPKKRDQALLDWLVVEDPDPMWATLAALESAPATQPTPDADRVHVRLVDDRALDITVQATRPAALLVAMPHDRGWEARVDGRPVAMTRAQYGLTALPVPAGNSLVELRYEVPGRRVGQWLSLAALLALLALAGRRWWLRRRG